MLSIVVIVSMAPKIYHLLINFCAFLLHNPISWPPTHSAYEILIWLFNKKSRVGGHISGSIAITLTDNEWKPIKYKIMLLKKYHKLLYAMYVYIYMHVYITKPQQELRTRFALN